MPKLSRTPDEMRRLKILIAVPTYENIYPDTFKSIFDLDPAGHILAFEFVRGYDCATARNNIVDLGRAIEADYILMVDNDVVLPKETIRYLTEELVDVCLGYYPHRSFDPVFDGRSSVCKLGEFNYLKQFTSEELKELKENDIHRIQVHGGGMGCGLIKTSLFDKLDYPWFRWVNYPDEVHGVLSEDLYFCEQCGLRKIPIWVDTRISCGHLFRHTQWMD